MRMNAASSRSHCIFRVHVEREKGKSGMSGGVGVSGTVLPTGASQHVTSSSMCFVDLAGSEKATQTIPFLYIPPRLYCATASP